MELTISTFLAKLILRLKPFNQIMVMHRGYGEYYENCTELVWEDDKHLDFHDR